MSGMTLKGYTRVNAQLMGLGKFQKKVQTAVNRELPAMESQARSDVLEVVYSAPENPDFPRSGNMAAATDVIMTSDPDSVTANVMLNPDKANEPFNYTYAGNVSPSGLRSFYDLTSRGGKKWYPIYVMLGIFFRKTGAPRDYRLKWRETIYPMFKSIAGKAVRAFR